MKKTVVLVDDQTYGHHLSFLKRYISVLLEGSYRVVVLFPETHLLAEFQNRQGFIAHQLKVERFEFPGNTKIGKVISGALYWNSLYKLICKIKKREKLNIDLVYFCWLDAMSIKYLSYRLVDKIFKLPWGGLIFHLNELRSNMSIQKPKISEKDYVFLSKNCKLVHTLDGKLAETLSARLDKTVTELPEIFDDSNPSYSFFLSLKINELKKGRKVVGLIGLEKRKGVLSLVKASIDLKSEPIYFVFVGKFFPNSFTVEEKSFLDAFFNNPPENVFYFPSPVQDGSEYNSLINVFDVVYICYQQFTGSSNVLKKAAFLNKPVIATQKFLIGEQVREFKLGKVVDEINQSEINRGIVEILENYDVYVNSMNSQKYINFHSKESFNKSLINSLENVL